MSMGMLLLAVGREKAALSLSLPLSLLGVRAQVTPHLLLWVRGGLKGRVTLTLSVGSEGGTSLLGGRGASSSPRLKRERASPTLCWKGKGGRPIPSLHEGG